MRIFLLLISLRLHVSRLWLSMAVVFITILNVSSVEAKPLKNGEEFKQKNGNAIRVVSSVEVEIETASSPGFAGNIFLGKYTIDGQRMRVVINQLGTSIVSYYKITPDGLVEEKGGTIYYSKAKIKAEAVEMKFVRDVITTIDQVKSGFYAYQDRYRAIPGDDPNARVRWSNTTNGNGNGSIDNDYKGTPGSMVSESSLFWEHLRLAGLINGVEIENHAGRVVGKNTFNGVTFIQKLRQKTVICLSNVPGSIANSVDYRVDDGKPQTGIIQIMVQQAWPLPASAQAVAVIKDEKKYIICSEI